MQADPTTFPAAPVLRRADERGYADHGWLRSRHTFSFGGYHDPAHMGFRCLRVMNEDWVAPAAGFGAHPHREMEIVTFVLEGALRHRDSTGGEAVLRAGELQRMSAGTGITHSEFNASEREAVRFYQIWLTPSVRGATPAYEQRAFAPEHRRNRLQLVLSPDGRDGSLSVGQDARMWLADLDAGGVLGLPVQDVQSDRHVWVQVMRGQARLGDLALRAGDGVHFGASTRNQLCSVDGCELMLFDLP